MAPKDWPRIEPYNPLSKRNLGETVAHQLLQSPMQSLPPDPFLGAGVYAIYYFGSLEMYARLSEVTLAGTNIPIYVGKAVPSGGRKGGLELDTPHGPELYQRLKEHAESIQEASNLELKDFRCQYLVVDDIWIPLAESLLIARLKPVWNVCLEGFGNHDPGRGRHGQKRSAWDIVHSGRAWAWNLASGTQTDAELQARVVQFLADALPDEP